MAERRPRIYLPRRLSAGERYTLTGDQHRHLSRVLRLKAGAELTLFDGMGGEYAATIEGVRREYECGGLDLILDPNSSTSIGDPEYGGGLVTILVGPEGGVDTDEREAACAVGFRGVSLGPRTLRTETAAVAGVTAVQLHWGDLK